MRAREAAYLGLTRGNDDEEGKRECGLGIGLSQRNARTTTETMIQTLLTQRSVVCIQFGIIR